MFCFLLLLYRIGGRGKDKNKQSPVTEEPKPYLEEKYTKAKSLIEYDVRDVVRLPAEMDPNEWFGTNCKWLVWWGLIVQ